MRASEYVDVAKEINLCREKAIFEVVKIQEALKEYRLDYGIDRELDAIMEALNLIEVTESEEDYEDD